MFSSNSGEIYFFLFSPEISCFGAVSITAQRAFQSLRLINEVWESSQQPNQEVWNTITCFKPPVCNLLLSLLTSVLQSMYWKFSALWSGPSDKSWSNDRQWEIQEQDLEKVNNSIVSRRNQTCHFCSAKHQQPLTLDVGHVKSWLLVNLCFERQRERKAAFQWEALILTAVCLKGAKVVGYLKMSCQI